MKQQEIVMKFMKENALTQADLSRALGVSTSAISQWLKEKYKGDADALGRKLNDYIKNYSPKTSQKDSFEVVRTRNMILSHSTIKQIISSQAMGMIYGTPGSGKSVMIDEFIKDKPNHILIEAIPGTRTTHILQEIAKKVGALESKDTVSMIKEIAMKLKGSDKFIIIDEAENLTTHTLESIRKIWDLSDERRHKGVPTILVGTYNLISNLRGRNGELLQLNSRVSRKVEFSQMSETEWEKIFGINYVEICKHTHNLRIARNLYEAALDFANELEEELNAGHIKDVLPTVVTDEGGA